MTGDWATPTAIAVIALVAFAMRCGGYIVINLLPIGRRTRKALKLAPGHLFTAFMAAAVVQGGLPYLAGVIVTVGTMAATSKDWLAMLSGGVAASAIAWLLAA
jgi:uncharacterized membrane protein